MTSGTGRCGTAEETDKGRVTHRRERVGFTFCEPPQLPGAEDAGGCDGVVADDPVVRVVQVAGNWKKSDVVLLFAVKSVAESEQLRG